MEMQALYLIFFQIRTVPSITRVRAPNRRERVMLDKETEEILLKTGNASWKQALKIRDE